MDLAKQAVDMGLELDYNSRIVRLYTMPDGSFTLQTSAGRVNLPHSSPWSLLDPKFALWLCSVDLDTADNFALRE